MTLDRALEIVRAICDRYLLPMGIVELKDVGSLQDVSLAEMIEAVAVCRQETERQKAQALENGGRYRIITVPADRLIAAAYALEHYEPDGEVIVARPLDRILGDIRVLGIVAQDLTREAAE